MPLIQEGLALASINHTHSDLSAHTHSLSFTHLQHIESEHATAVFKCKCLWLKGKIQQVTTSPIRVTPAYLISRLPSPNKQQFIFSWHFQLFFQSKKHVGSKQVAWCLNIQEPFYFHIDFCPFCPSVFVPLGWV